MTVNKKILVRVNLNQKDFIKIGDAILRMASLFENNHREKNPILAEVVEGNNILNPRDIICCHHNHFGNPSPYYLMDNLYSIPVNKTIFGKFDAKGTIQPTYGNMICQPIEIETSLPLPIEKRANYINRYVVYDPGDTKYQKGQIIFTRPYSGYEIVYIWQNIENRVVKVDSEMVCGILK